MSVVSRAFWRQALERAVKTAAQVVVVAVFVSDTGPVNAFDLDWELGLGVALGGAALSLLTSVGSEPFGPPDDPSAV